MSNSRTSWAERDIGIYFRVMEAGKLLGGSHRAGLGRRGLRPYMLLQEFSVRWMGVRRRVMSGRLRLDVELFDHCDGDCVEGVGGLDRKSVV